MVAQPGGHVRVPRQHPDVQLFVVVDGLLVAEPGIDRVRVLVHLRVIGIETVVVPRSDAHTTLPTVDHLAPIVTVFAARDQTHSRGVRLDGRRGSADLLKGFDRQGGVLDEP